MNGYKVNIDYTRDINDQDLLQETRVILSLIYRDFICDEDKKQKLIEEDKRALKEREAKLKEKYNLDDQYANKQENNKQIEEKTETMIKHKESFFKKIIKWFTKK